MKQKRNKKKKQKRKVESSLFQNLFQINLKGPHKKRRLYLLETYRLNMLSIGSKKKIIFIANGRPTIVSFSLYTLVVSDSVIRKFIQQVTLLLLPFIFTQ